MARTTVSSISLLALLVSGISLAPMVNAQQQPIPPAGIEPLPVDLFTSETFYFDREHWTDPRYARCNTPRGRLELAGPPGHGIGPLRQV